MRYLTIVFLIIFGFSSLQAQTPRINQLKKELATSSSDSIKVRVLIDLINQYIGHNPDSLPHFAKQLDENPKKGENSVAQENVNVAYAMYYYDKADFDSSLIFINRNIALAREKGNDAAISSNLTNASIILLGQSKYEEAIGYLLQALEVQEGNENIQPHILANTYSVLSNVYHNLKNYEQAQDYQFKALNIYKADNRTIELIRAYTNLGSNYIERNKVDSAIYYFDVGLKLSRQNNEERSLAQLSRMIGDLYIKQENYDSALFHYENSVEYFSRNRSNNEVSGSMVGLGTAYYEKGRYQDAYNMHKQAKDLFAEKGDEMETSRCLWLMSRDLNKLGRHADAYGLLVESKSLGDSLYVKNGVEAIAEMQTKYETEKKDKELAIQTAELTEKESELQQQQTLRNFAAIGALSLGIVAFLIYRIKTKSNKAISAKNDQLGKSLSEREALLKEIHHRVKNNLQVIAGLLYLQSDKTDDVSVKKLLEEGQGRVRSMALIHQKLYENEDLKHIPFEEYLSELVGEIKKTFGASAEGVDLHIEAKDIQFDVDTAVPLGLIINELSTNAFKYAYTDKMGGALFSVKLEKKEGQYEMTVSDNGSGIPEDVLSATKSSSLGLRLTRMLSDQLEGEYQFDNAEGARFKLKFAV